MLLGRAQLYSYDGLSRLTEADVGRLNSGRTDILSEWSDPRQIQYTMDILGNITTLARVNSGVTASETRVYNATNELTSRTVVGESPVYFVNDDFADNDTTGWKVKNINTGSSGEAWAASAGRRPAPASKASAGRRPAPASNRAGDVRAQRWLSSRRTSRVFLVWAIPSMTGAARRAP